MKNMSYHIGKDAVSIKIYAFGLTVLAKGAFR